jgi:hypothetical protein
VFLLGRSIDFLWGQLADLPQAIDEVLCTTVAQVAYEGTDISLAKLLGTVADGAQVPGLLCLKVPAGTAIRKG